MLVLAAVLSFVAVGMVSIPHQASAKVCISTNSNHGDKNNNYVADTTCTQQQNSNNDDISSTVTDKTPFLLVIPFP